MSALTLILRSVSHHWRTNLAVCLGIAAAVAHPPFEEEVRERILHRLVQQFGGVFVLRSQILLYRTSPFGFGASTTCLPGQFNHARINRRQQQVIRYCLGIERRRAGGSA